MGKLCDLRYDIEGIYGWGKGFYTQELCFAWNNFWEIKQNEKIDKREHFKVGCMNQGSSVLEHPILYGDSGTMFCHPMEITGVLYSCGSVEHEKFEYERKAIYDFLKELADFIKDNTDVEIKIIERYYLFDKPMSDWTMEERTA